MLVLLGVRLHQGPMNVDFIRPVIADRIKDKMPGSHVAIKHLDLVWFGDETALGFRFDDLIILDGKNRIILRAGKLETALAADSLLLLHFDPARLTASDFFAVTSVSKLGKYELGYEAHGAPEAVGGLEQIINDLTGPERLGHPFSFARQMALKDGQFRLIEENTALDWTARVDTIDFSKRKGRLRAHANLAIAGEGGGPVATLNASADGTVGLTQSAITADIARLVPAHVFPAAGVTHYLSLIDAPLNGRATVQYSVKKGFEYASGDLSAGKGYLRLGDVHQNFDGAQVSATYESATRTAIFKTFRLQAHLIDADLHGKVKLTPEDAKTKTDFAIAFDFSGPRVTGRLADDFSLQTLTDVHFKGAFIPKVRQLKIETGTGKLNGAPFDSEGMVYTDEQGRLGTDLKARINGRFTKDEVFAFWPEDLSHILRGDLIERIKGGDFANANFVFRIKPGEDLNNQNLRLDFDFSNAEIAAEHRLANITGLKGHGILLGDSFAMDVTEGRLVEVGLTHGGLLVPSFHEHDTRTHIWLESQGDAVKVIEAVDPITSGDLGKHGLNKTRMAGTAETRVDITFPTFHEINEHTFGLTFDAHIHDGGLKEAALGWDMSGAELEVKGDLLANTLSARGPAQVGPYNGLVTYDTQFTPKTQRVTIDGHFNAAQFGGSPKVPVAITGQFNISGGKGQGKVQADIFRGDVTWSNEGSDDPERPSQVVVQGATLASGMMAQGLPMFDHLPQELPTRISLLRSGEIWSGTIDAEALSGDLAYVQGNSPRLVYKSIITPAEAKELGYGALPVFKVPRHLTVNVALDAQSKEALLKLDDMNAVLGWSEVKGSDDVLRRLTMTVQPADWVTMGLPTLFFHPSKPVALTALWRQDAEALKGTVTLLGQDIDFEMPTREARGAAPAGQPKPDLRVRGVMDDRVMAALGYTQTPVHIMGVLGVVFSLYDTPGLPAAVLNVDASEAQLGVRATDWTKPAGEKADFAVSFDDRGDQGGVNLSRIVGEGDRIRIDGRASFSDNGDLEFADFSSLYLKDFIDVTFKYYVLPGQNTNVMAISGAQLDLRPWLQNETAPEAPAPASTLPAVVEKAQATVTPTHFVLDLGRLQTAPLGAFSKLKLDVAWDGHSQLTGQGSALTMDGSPVAVAFQGVPVKGKEPEYTLFNIRTGDFGDVLRTFSGVTNVYGGTAVAEGTYRDGQIDAGVRGQNTRAKQIPVLAQLLTVASLTGLNDTLTGEGIAFTDFDFPVRYRDNVVFVRNGWAKGKALGLNVWGTTDLDHRTYDLNGTIIPAYRINALFGDVKTNGLGLVGIKYDVKGGFKLPVVGVNPLSIMMPGFMKVWENDQRKDAIAPLDLAEPKDIMNGLRQKTAEALKQ
ncbi:hypothetical protein [Asticcacaulis solisilvae]|uniref:hypothetical protein n=1 Tax=Asticcacaulis solisilvae TaxID=1217274 RepID=UPI003FD8B20A